MWEARLRFEPRASSGVALTTPVESTQSNEQSLVRWAEHLGTAFFDGAFERALASTERKGPPRPVKGKIAGTTRVNPRSVERRVLECFKKTGASTLNREAFFEQIDDFSNADVVRAIEALERARVVQRFTERGAAWVALTAKAEAAKARKQSP